MVTGLVIGAWVLAALVGLVVLGFCAYEIVAKTRRLQADVRALQAVNAELAQLQSGFAEIQARLAASQAALKSG